MRNRTPVPIHTALLLGLILALGSSLDTLASPCPGEISWLLNSHEILTPEPGEPIIQRAVPVPSAGILILEASNPTLDGGRPWVDVGASPCQPNEIEIDSDRNPRMLYRQLDRRIIEVAEAGVVYLEAGWVNRADWGSPLEIMAQFTPTLLPADNWAEGSRLVFEASGDGETNDDEDGDGTGELDNEILPSGEDGDGTGELDNEILPSGEDGDGTGELDNEILPSGEDGDGTGELDNEILPSGEDEDGILLRSTLGRNTLNGFHHWSFVLKSPRRVLFDLQAEHAAAVRLFEDPRLEISAFESHPGRPPQTEVLLPSGTYHLRLEPLQEKVTRYSLEVSSHPIP
ncbi:MAG: hypothetical protein K0U98_04280 [Deltaproteobacteria bacterium]|nr:hypothetical protein [Deltaproteobacteria bacterium]